MTLRAGRGGMLLRMRSNRSVFWNVNEISLYLLSPKPKQSCFSGLWSCCSGSKGPTLSFCCRLAEHERENRRGIAGLNGNIVPNYRSGPSKEPPVPPAGYQLTRCRKLAGVCGRRNRRSGTEATQRSDGQGGSRAQHRCSALMSRAPKTDTHTEFMWVKKMLQLR